MTERPSKDCITVAVPGGRELLLTYRAPEGFDPTALTGFRVQVPLGPRSVIGVVVGPAETPQDNTKLRSIEELLDSTPSFPPDLIELTRWIADYYMTPWGEVLRAALPGGLLREPSLMLTWTGPELFEQNWPEGVKNDPAASKAAKLLAERSPVSLSAFKKKWGRGSGLLVALRKLESEGLAKIEEKSSLDRDRAHTVDFIRAAEGAVLESLPERATAKRKVLAVLLASGEGITWDKLREETKASRPTLNSLVELGLAEVNRIPRELAFSGFDPRSGSPDQPLTNEQMEAVKAVRSSIDGKSWSPLLLTGLPGTGKTRVYIEALKTTLAAGRGAILLVPEIALTPQVVARIRASLDEPVVVLHSGLTATHRVAAWREVLEGRARVVVGPRSAIFAPVQHLGLIVVDEEHEESYKQHDPAPRYHARDVALVRGQRAGAAVLLVSATPSLEAVRLVEEGQLQKLTLRKRFGSGWPIITVVDRRRESADAPYIGAHLAREIETRAKKGEGIILLITRRGFAPVLACGDCGTRFECPNCSVSLTYHASRSPWLKCHLCGYSKRVPDTCPSCHGENLQPLGAGTQRIEEEIRRRFPALAPVRMDADTTRMQGEHERILRAFSDGDAGLLLGTQIIAKGHDFEHVTLVGVVNADPSLFQPDFRAAERTFRLLVQASGRAGRGKMSGEVVIQTLNPEDPVFYALMEPDVEGFSTQQLKFRQELDYPPYVRMAMLTLYSDNPGRAEEAAHKVAEALSRSGNGLQVRGPAPAFVNRVKRRWRWRVMVSTPRETDPQGRKLRNTLRNLLKELKLPPGTGSTIDVDPLEVV